MSINFQFQSFHRVYDRNWLNSKFCGGGPQVEPKPTSSGKNLLILWNTTLRIAAQLMSRHCSCLYNLNGAPRWNVSHIWNGPVCSAFWWINYFTPSIFLRSSLFTPFYTLIIFTMTASVWISYWIRGFEVGIINFINLYNIIY